MTSIDQQFIEYIVKSLVGKPDAVKIDRRIDDLGVLLELTVDPEDLGRVIGKRGATAQSLRTLLRALGTKNEERYNLKIIDNGAPRPPRDDSGAAPAPTPPPMDDNSNDSSSSDDNAPSEEEAPAVDTSDSSSGDSWSNEAPTPEPTPSHDLELDEDSAEPSQDNSDRVSKTRQELSELDDLDI